jgi:hypothetical protein
MVGGGRLAWALAEEAPAVNAMRVPETITAAVDDFMISPFDMSHARYRSFLSLPLRSINRYRP